MTKAPAPKIPDDDVLLRGDYESLASLLPPTPYSSAPIELTVVSKRCVYANNYRIAGGKPYVSENLPQHTLKTSLRDVLAAFRTEEILAVLAEQTATAAYWKAVHARVNVLKARRESDDHGD